MEQSRTRRRWGVFVATGVVAAGLAAFPAFTFADGNGNGNGNGNGHAHQNNNGNGHGHGNGNGNDQGEDNGDDNAGVGHVRICHSPPGNPDNAHTITVGAPAVAAHMANHGDRLGPCETTTTTEAPTTTTSTTSTTTSTSTSTVALQPTVTVSYTPTVDPRFCSVVIDLTDFGASQSYDVTLIYSSPTLTNPASPWTFSNVPTDTAQFVAFSYFQGLPEDASFTASTNGISSDPVNVSC